MKQLNSKEFKQMVEEYTKLAKQMQITNEMLMQTVALYAGLEVKDGKVEINEENDRVNYYKFMQEVFERLDKIEKKLDELTARKQ